MAWGNGFAGSRSRCLGWLHCRFGLVRLGVKHLCQLLLFLFTDYLSLEPVLHLLLLRGPVPWRASFHALHFAPATPALTLVFFTSLFSPPEEQPLLLSEIQLL